MSSRSFDYQEKVARPLKSTENGQITGADLTATYWMSPYNINIYGANPPTEALHAKLSYASGTTTYDGSDQQGSPIVEKGKKNRFIDVGATLSTPFVWETRGFVGLGYRTWARGVDAAPPSYREDYDWFHADTGVTKRVELTPDLWLMPELDLSLPFLSQLTVDLSKFSTSEVTLKTARVSLDVKPYYRVQLPLAYALAANVQVGLSPWYQHISIGGSKATPVLVRYQGQTYALMIHEPASTTSILGADLTCTYHF